MAKKTAYVAVCIALSVVCLLLASTLPTARAALAAVSAVFGALVVCEFGHKLGWLHYAGVSILALLLLPNRLYALLYIGCVGYYPMLKLYIERLRRLWLEWGIKLVLFALLAVGACLTGRALMAAGLLPASAGLLDGVWWLAGLAAFVIFIIYDVALSVVLGYYQTTLRKHLHLSQ